MIAFAYRRRQAEEGDTNTRLFGLFGGNNGCNCGRRRRRRQAPGEGEPGVRFFGLENLLGGGGSNNCGCNCGYNQYPQNNYPSNNYPSNNYPSNNYPSNSGNTYIISQWTTWCWYLRSELLPVQLPADVPRQVRQHTRRLQVSVFNIYFRIIYTIHRRPDETGRTWCYTTGGWGCSDARQSQRFPNNPWSYQACSFSG